MYLAVLGLSCSLRTLSCSMWDQFPDEESNSGLLHWEHRVSATAPLGLYTTEIDTCAYVDIFKGHHFLCPYLLNLAFPFLMRKRFLDIVSLSVLMFLVLCLSGALLCVLCVLSHYSSH